ncbi:MAG: IPT/TIG domain-containing protein [Acidobacteriota bacterium]
MASLGVSVVITLGCGTSPGPRPSPPLSFSVRSIVPTEGSSVGATVASIAGTGFESGATVTVDGSRVDATVLSANTISLAMPAHSAGIESGGLKTVTVTVINPLSQAQASVPGGYMYVGPPVISKLLPNIGSTGGGAPVNIIGTGTGAMWSVVTLTVDGIVSTFEDGWPSYDAISSSMPAHAAGTVEVIVTDRYGRTGSSEFTYASPATFDFNGDWLGSAVDTSVSLFSHLVVLTIRDNSVVSVSCGNAPSLTLDPPPVVANGEFSFAGSGGVSITGKILSPDFASGSINMASGSINRDSCGSHQWSVDFGRHSGTSARGRTSGFRSWRR